MPTIRENYNSFARTNSPKNYIINPSMAISQEQGDTPASNPFPSALYMADQFLSFDAGSPTGNYSMQAFYGFAGSRSVRFTADSAIGNLASSSIGTHVQQLEANNVFFLNGKTVTVSFDLRTNWSGTLSFAMTTKSDVRSYVSEIPVTAGEQRVSVTLDLEATSVATKDNDVGLNLYLGYIGGAGTKTGNLDQWQAGAFVLSDTATEWWTTAANYIEITNVQLVEGGVPAEFQPNTYEEDLSACRRYFERIEARANTDLWPAQCISTTTALLGILFAQKRTIPSVSFSNQTTGWRLRNATGGIIPVISISTPNVSEIGTDLEPIVSSGLVAGNANVFAAVSDQFIDVNARL